MILSIYIVVCFHTGARWAPLRETANPFSIQLETFACSLYVMVPIALTRTCGFRVHQASGLRSLFVLIDPPCVLGKDHRSKSPSSCSSRLTCTSDFLHCGTHMSQGVSCHASSSVLLATIGNDGGLVIDVLERSRSQKRLYM